MEMQRAQVQLINFSRNESDEMRKSTDLNTKKKFELPRDVMIIISHVFQNFIFFFCSGFFNDSKGGDNAINEFTDALHVDIVIDIAEFESIHR